MEAAETVALFDTPLHPYTRGLMRAIPAVTSRRDQGELYEISGVVPSLLNLPSGCPFNPRCPLVGDICRRQEPELREATPGHWVPCWMPATGPVIFSARTSGRPRPKTKR
ncbi:MAG: oligopeptide/dipeptide ABC transporter ATP-binding protein [Desulfobacterales bacterium]